MKVIIIGTSLSGKTTLVRYLRANTSLSLLEIDEELTRVNNGKYPTDNIRKHKILIPQIVKNILDQTDVIFFTNTDYFTVEDLKQARKNGFKILQLSLDLEQLQKRNTLRVQKEGYSDLNQWLRGMVDYQTTVREKGLVDKVINANQATEYIAKELIDYLL